MTKALLGLLTAHPATASFAWGLFKALIPFPTPSFYLLAGAELARGGARPAAAFVRVLLRLALPGAAGGVLGAYPYYWWARRGGWRVVERGAPWLGVQRAQVKIWETKWTDRKRRRDLALAGAAAFSMLLGGLFAGLVEAAFWEFAVWAFLGGVVRAEILGLTGWRMRAYGDPDRLFGTGTLILGAVLASSVVVWSRFRDSRASRK
jgi:membrane protein DedA with SNARE-associated domain